MTSNIRPFTQRAALAQSVLAALLVTCATAASAGSVCSEHAATASAATHAVRVSYGDLNLATAAGARALNARLTQAARKACSVGDIRDLDALAQSSSCQRAAVATALEQVQNAHLAARYEPLAPRG